MNLTVSPHARDFGAAITGVDLSKPLEAEVTDEIRALWLRHQVIYFPDQPLDHPQLAAFTRAFGTFGIEPYVQVMDDHDHIIEVRREPDEKISPFGASWHSDWSFQNSPPAATILHSKITPPVGGETWYADGYAAYDALEEDERTELESYVALHSARRPYSPQGFFASGGSERSMTILPSEKAHDIQEHPLIRSHPETGRRALWVNSVYTIAIKDMDDAQSRSRLKRLFAHSIEDRFIYRHRWASDMLIMWDNRCVQHCAQGGYDGHRRVMHRTTVAGDAPYLDAATVI
ncbi:MAG: TauD/TfdA family dioxygenase [Gammaproteobacteria bacterium]|nr:TauD/TfdA family dioxygenase [Gammaproteobacteria bacterium]